MNSPTKKVARKVKYSTWAAAIAAFLVWAGAVYFEIELPWDLAHLGGGLIVALIVGITGYRVRPSAEDLIITVEEGTKDPPGSDLPRTKVG